MLTMSKYKLTTIHYSVYKIKVCKNILKFEMRILNMGRRYLNKQITEQERILCHSFITCENTHRTISYIVHKKGAIKEVSCF